MNVLVIGSGGREHALCWKIKQSPLVQKVYCAPGNAGITSEAQCVDISVSDFDSLIDFAVKNSIELTIVGTTMLSITFFLIFSFTIGAGQYAPIPPVLGPLSSSYTAL